MHRAKSVKRIIKKFQKMSLNDSYKKFYFSAIFGPCDTYEMDPHKRYALRAKCI